MPNLSLKTVNIPHRVLCPLLGVITALLISACDNPLDYESGGALPQYDRYIVQGYVTRSGAPVYNKSVWLYIKDYSYTVWETTFECKTDYRGYYRFIVTFEDWNYYYYNLTCELQQENSRIIFGKVERIDFEL